MTALTRPGSRPAAQFAAASTGATLKNTLPNLNATPTNGLADFTLGFPPVTGTDPGAGGVPPYAGDFNGILNFVDQHLHFLAGGGRYRFDATFAASIGGYPIGYVLQSDDGLSEYVSATAANTTNFNTTPSSIGVNWLAYSGDAIKAFIRRVVVSNLAAADATFGQTTPFRYGIEVVTAGGTNTVTYLVPFNNQTDNIITSLVGGGTAPTAPCWITARSATGFSVNNPNATSFSVLWTAHGH
jgi:hypothetical protein